MTDGHIRGHLKAKAEKDINSGRAELLYDLKRLPNLELHKVDPTLLARLTPAQRAELFSQASRQNLEKFRTRSSVRPVTRPGRPSFAHRLWNSLPLVVRCQLVGLGIAILLAKAVTFVFMHEDEIFAYMVRPTFLPSNALLWPACGRLTPHTDGCTYPVTNALAWREAAHVLGLDVNNLVRVNPHLAARALLQRGDNLIIWRARIPLER